MAKKKTDYLKAFHCCHPDPAQGGRKIFLIMLLTGKDPSLRSG
jgi:hypothetical protein